MRFLLLLLFLTFYGCENSVATDGVIDTVYVETESSEPKQARFVMRANSTIMCYSLKDSTLLWTHVIDSWRDIDNADSAIYPVDDSVFISTNATTFDKTFVISPVIFGATYTMDSNGNWY